MVYLALGSNLGDRRRYLDCALSALSEKGEIVEVSSLWETEPVGYKDDRSYLNMACSYRTQLEPEALRLFAEATERRCGRKQKSSPEAGFAAREIDIDIIFYGDAVISTEDLIVPHPRADLRSFVLFPMREIAPDFVHPALGMTVRDLADKVPGGEIGIKQYDGA